jgi:hypothetical protein
MRRGALLLAGTVLRARRRPRPDDFWFHGRCCPGRDERDRRRTSGENAYHMIMQTGGYDMDGPPRIGRLHETTFYLGKAREYGFQNAETPVSRRHDMGRVSDLLGSGAIRQKGSGLDSAAMLATGSATGEATGELIWVGLGWADLQTRTSGKIVAPRHAATHARLVQRSARRWWGCLRRGPCSTRPDGMGQSVAG